MKSPRLRIGDKKAVLVGINQYSDDGVAGLNYSANDVKSFFDILVDNDRGQYDPRNVKLLVDNGQDHPTRSNVMSAITSLSRSANAEDSILFYFSGHGIEEDRVGYVLPSDSRVNVLKDTAIKISWVKEALAASDARVKILVLDACHAGALIGKAESGRMTKIFHASIFPPPEGFAVLSSCKLDEVSYEWPDQQHSVFSYFLLEGLRGAADRDRDNIISVTDASNYVSEKVKDWGFRNSKQQSPTLECKISGDILLVRVPREEMVPELAPRDKGVIASIIITQKNIGTVSTEDQSQTEALEEASAMYLENADRICGRLIEFFQPNEISREEWKITFPAGLIEMAYSGTDSEIDFWLKMTFPYSKKNWKLTDAIIESLSGTYDFDWDMLVYRFRSKLNLDLLVKRCKQRGFKIVSFRPPPGEKLEIIAAGWGSSESQIVFWNTKSKSSLRISPISESRLARKFYETVKPENVLEFLSGCFT